MQAVSEKMTPNEIKNKEFKRTPLGYSPQDVVTFLDGVARAWEGVQRNEKVLIQKIKDLEGEIRQWKDRETELSRLKEIALKDADGIRDAARADAKKIFEDIEVKAGDVRLKTEEWLTDLLAEIEETQRQRNSFITAFRTSLDSHYELLKEEKYEEALGQRLMSYLKGKTQGIPVPEGQNSH